MNPDTPAPDNLLVTGVPGVGKTTFIISLLSHLDIYRPVGFYTREIREGGTRAGFELVSLSGRTMVLAHTRIHSSHRVGKYGVDIDGFRTYLGEIKDSLSGHGLVIFDEIGKMEVLSGEFRELVLDVLDGPTPLLGTISRKGDPFIEGIKQRPDVRVVEVTRANRGEIAGTVLPLIRKMIERRGSDSVGRS